MMRSSTKVIEEPDEDDIPLSVLKARNDNKRKVSKALSDRIRPNGNGRITKAKDAGKGTGKGAGTGAGNKRVFIRKLRELGDSSDDDDDFSQPIKIRIGAGLARPPPPKKKVVSEAPLEVDSDRTLGSSDTDTDTDSDDSFIVPDDAPEEALYSGLRSGRDRSHNARNSEEGPLYTRIMSAPISEIQRKHCLSLLRAADDDRDALNAIELILSLPSNIKGHPVSLQDPYERVHTSLLEAWDIMDSEVYGHQMAKSQILEYLVARTVGGSIQPRILGLQGPPGVGKTSLVLNGISKALGLPFYHLSIGGLRDVTYFKGSLRCWKGSHQGIFSDILIKMGCLDPVIYIDEMDKVAAEGAMDIYGLLTHATDPLGNHQITDHYMGMDLDLSRVTFVFSFNDESVLPIPLRDRINIVRLNGFSETEKVHIAERYIIPKLLKTLNLEHDVIFSEEVIAYTNSLLLHHEPPSEALQGVRYLQRGYETLLSKILVNMVWYKSTYDTLRHRNGFGEAPPPEAQPTKRGRGKVPTPAIRRIMPYIKPLKFPFKPTIADVTELLQ